MAEDTLSPTSVLRLNFESLCAETTDPVASEDGASALLWGVVTLPDFVRSNRVVSWIEEGLQQQPVFFNEVLCIKKVENVRMIDKYNTRNPVIGTLYVTTTQLIFAYPDSNKETWISHMHIDSVEKLPLTTTGSPLLIRCKTFLSVTYVIAKERECHDLYLALLKLSQPVHISDLYCFYYTSEENQLKEAGWEYYKLESEFKRMRVPNENWTLYDQTLNYELCDTYPKLLHVPAGVSKAMLVGSSKFRSKGRLPVLTYLHPNRASICRCSQPLSGFSARCLEDEQMLEAVRRTNPNPGYMYVVDTRPRINAMANRAAGKGYENEAFYENTKFCFLGIENIHVMRTSLQKMLETCELKTPQTMSAFLGALESSGWLKHIRAILDTSLFIANAVDKGISVVVHCSDGWDRTAQVCSLAAVMLDPYYRTIKGFQALIEKDWLAFGHKFGERCGYTQTDPKEKSPVFTQFLDCTWQLMQQRSDAFEFNERFLLILHDHVQSCQYGTFVGNCEKDRVDLRLAERTYSLWGYMTNHLNEYVNPLYRPEMDEILRPNLAPQIIQFWRGMYSRFESGVHPREDICDILLSSRDHCASLEDHVQYLTKHISNFKNLISKSAKKLQNSTAAIAGVASSNGGGEGGGGASAREGSSSSSSSLAAEGGKQEEEKEVDVNDNRFIYEKKLSEISDPNDDHPLATNFSFSTLSIAEKEAKDLDALSEEINSVALDWKSFRNVTQCTICTTPFDQFSQKCNCWKCGDVFCTRCIIRTLPLPGHESGNAVPLCRPCSLVVQKTPA